MPLQLEHDQVFANATHAKYGVEVSLHNHFSSTSMLERYGGVTEGLSGLAVRPVVEHDDVVGADLKRALDAGYVGSGHMNITTPS